MLMEITFRDTRFRRGMDRAEKANQSIARKRLRFACPQCTAENLVTIEQVARQVKVNCTGCHSTVSLVDNGGGFARRLDQR